MFGMPRSDSAESIVQLGSISSRGVDWIGMCRPIAQRCMNPDPLERPTTFDVFLNMRMWMGSSVGRTCSNGSYVCSNGSSAATSALKRYSISSCTYTSTSISPTCSSALRHCASQVSILQNSPVQAIECPSGHMMIEATELDVPRHFCGLCNQLLSAIDGDAP